MKIDITLRVGDSTVEETFSDVKEFKFMDGYLLLLFSTSTNRGFINKTNLVMFEVSDD